MSVNMLWGAITADSGWRHVRTCAGGLDSVMDLKNKCRRVGTRAGVRERVWEVGNEHGG